MPGYRQHSAAVYGRGRTLLIDWSPCWQHHRSPERAALLQSMYVVNESKVAQDVGRHVVNELLKSKSWVPFYK